MKRYANPSTLCVRSHRAVPQLLGLVQRPVKAVVLLYPDYEGLEKENEEEDARIANEGQPQLDDTIFWIKQTVPFFRIRIVTSSSRYHRSTMHAEPWPLFMPWPMYVPSFIRNPLHLSRHA